MATGLLTFDSFTWASLLKGRASLVVDRDAARARRYAGAIEEAGATATLALNQATGADRARDERFSLAILGLSGDERLSERVAAPLAALGHAFVILAETERHAALRAAFPKARIGDHSMSDRDLVMFLIGTPDE